MQVSIQSGTGLERTMKISLPSSQIDAETERQLKKIANDKSVSLPGFRPGMIPLPVVKQQYGRSARQRAMEDLMQSSFEEAIKQQSLSVAGVFEFKPATVQPASSFEFEARFEIYPEIKSVTLKGVALEKVEVDLEESDLNLVLDKMRKQHQEWVEVNRPAKQEDKITLNYKGIVENHAADDVKGENLEVIIGAQRMIPGFEEGCIGTTPGKDITLSLTFPEQYHYAAVAGKPVEFHIHVLHVYEPKLPALDDDFASRLGITGGVEALREEVRNTVKKNLAEKLAEKFKHHILDKLLEKNAYDVPKSLVMREAMALQKSAMQRFQGGKQSQKPLNLPLELFEEQAKRRIALALIFSAAVKELHLHLDEARVKQKIEEIAAAYQNPKGVVDFYYNNRERMNEIQATVLEDQVIEKLLEEAKIVVKKGSYSEVMEFDQLA